MRKYFIALAILFSFTLSARAVDIATLEKIIIESSGKFSVGDITHNSELPVTPAFAKSAYDVDQAQIEANCEKVVSNVDETCGLDYSPIICAQDLPAELELTILKESANEITAELKNPKAKYRLIKQSGEWLIDGVDCGKDKFNWKEMSK